MIKALTKKNWIDVSKVFGDVILRFLLLYNTTPNPLCTDKRLAYKNVDFNLVTKLYHIENYVVIEEKNFIIECYNKIQHKHENNF